MSLEDLVEDLLRASKECVELAHSVQEAADDPGKANKDMSLGREQIVVVPATTYAFTLGYVPSNGMHPSGKTDEEVAQETQSVQAMERIGHRVGRVIGDAL